MRRFLLTMAMVSGVAMLVAAPAAHAQYGGGGDTTTTTTTTSPTTTAPPPPRVAATTSNPTPQPGDSVPISFPSDTFEAGTQVAFVLVPASGDSDIPGPSVTADGDGNITVTIPEDTPPGVYIIALIGEGADGRQTVVLVPVVVRRTVAAASTGGAASEGSSFQTASAEPLPDVPVLQTELPADVEAAVVDAVTAGDAELMISPQGELNVRTPDGSVQAAGALAATGNDISGLVTAGGALILAGTGLVLMRRRKGAQL